MRTLLLMRHAKSSWDDPELEDHDRPLNDRGLHDSPRMGALLLQQGLVPDCIVSSTALRALRTARLVARECRFDKALTATADLYHASENDWREKIRQLPDQHLLVLCIGHNPGLEDFLASWTGQYVRMPTAAIARLAFDEDSWSDVADRSSATLVDLWRPRDLPENN
jgi:phosphohistidine phosphatase